MSESDSNNLKQDNVPRLASRQNSSVDGIENVSFFTSDEADSDDGAQSVSVDKQRKTNANYKQQGVAPAYKQKKRNPVRSQHIDKRPPWRDVISPLQDNSDIGVTSERKNSVSDSAVIRGNSATIRGRTKAEDYQPESESLFTWIPG
jgi:hypothetical protein